MCPATETCYDSCRPSGGDRSSGAHHGRVYLFFEHIFDRLLAGYEWGLKRVLTYQFLTLCVFLGMMVVTGGLYVEIPKKFFPKQDTGSISDSAEGAQDISSAAMWNHLADLDELDVWAPKLVAKLQSLPQLADVTSDQQANAASATLIIDRDRTARFGIQPALIDATIYAAIGQRDVAQVLHAAQQLPRRAGGRPGAADRSAFVRQAVSHLTHHGTASTLCLYFVRVDMTKTGYLVINHQSQFPSVTVSFNLAAGVALGDAVTAVQQAEVELGVPATLTGSFQGTARAFQASLSTTPYLIAAALLVVYLILGVLYESFIHPLTILSTLPSAAVGALVMLMLFGCDLSIIAIIGIIMLIGIVKKNGTMMVDFAMTAEREQHLSPEEAIYQACVLRFRPIMMTTMCAILGGLPLMLAGGTGSELRQPLGFAMVGGLLLSQALTLFTTPVVYLYLDRLSNWRKPHETTPAPGHNAVI